MKSEDRKGAPLYNYEVEHPDFGKVTLPSIGADSAVVTACKAWGAEYWKELPGDCTVRKLGKVEQPRCPRCGARVYTAGNLCSDCFRREELHRRDMARMKGPDRRPGYAH